MTFRQVSELVKLRIGIMIAATAVTGYAAVADELRTAPALLLALAMLLGSGAAALFNHVCDRDIDRLMSRTRARPLATGLVRPADALGLAGLLMATAMTVAVLAFNWVVALHLFLGAFVYGIVYTVWLKRRTWLNIVVGGAAGSFAVLAGAAAVEPTRWLLPALLAVTLFLWTPSHFWSLAILLADDYRAARVPMLPVVAGIGRTAWAILFNSVLLVASSLAPWLLGVAGPAYAIAAGAAGLLLLGLNLALALRPGRKLAGWNFAASIPYLLVLFAGIVVDRHW
ncbi:heme o synthase [Magnetospirillum sp. UT-4]|uniref:heme o synthase n=1 Tax=Magnetospirillum sp. UT-4 TaxID=2681467 RepID=UPI001380C03D|nr:heme o synthase [Magnetospirillum sp. UT-4]CAA7618685.1 Protoheme IX farnesyltransferase 1 [Magnetospirillum sp. UT-4]